MTRGRHDAIAVGRVCFRVGRAHSLRQFDFNEPARGEEIQLDLLRAALSPLPLAALRIGVTARSVLVRLHQCRDAFIHVAVVGVGYDSNRSGEAVSRASFEARVSATSVVL